MWLATTRSSTSFGSGAPADLGRGMAGAAANASPRTSKASERMAGFWRSLPPAASDVRRAAMQIRHARRGDEADLARLLEEMEDHYGHAVSSGAGAPGAAFLTSLPHGGPLCLV